MCTWLVLQLVSGTLDVAPRFEGSATVVVAQTLVTMDDRGMQVEYHDGRAMAYALTDTADWHTEVDDVDAAAAAHCGNDAEVNDGDTAAAKQRGTGQARRALRRRSALSVQAGE
jgi:hypothetical protein